MTKTGTNLLSQARIQTDIDAIDWRAAGSVAPSILDMLSRATRCGEVLSAGAGRLVVTHGTDSMEETAFANALVVEPGNQMARSSQAPPCGWRALRRQGCAADCPTRSSARTDSRHVDHGDRYPCSGGAVRARAITFAQLVALPMAVPVDAMALHNEIPEMSP
jgi:hypothetical protein